MTAQATAGGVSGPQFFDLGGIVQSALFQMAQGLWVEIALPLIESGGLLEHRSRVGAKSAWLLEVSEALAKGQMAGLNKAKERSFAVQHHTQTRSHRKVLRSYFDLRASVSAVKAASLRKSGSANASLSSGGSFKCCSTSDSMS